MIVWGMSWVNGTKTTTHHHMIIIRMMMVMITSSVSQGSTTSISEERTTNLLHRREWRESNLWFGVLPFNFWPDELFKQPRASGGREWEELLIVVELTVRESAVQQEIQREKKRISLTLVHCLLFSYSLSSPLLFSSLFSPYHHDDGCDTRLPHSPALHPLLFYPTVHWNWLLTTVHLTSDDDCIVGLCPLLPHY